MRPQASSRPDSKLDARSGRAALLWLAAYVFVAAAVPRPAHAWTRAHVRGAQAHLEVIDSETANVAMNLGLHIGGGWLSELELPGIPADVIFADDKPATIVSATGEKYLPEMVLRRGVWRVTFAHRQQAPWRGDYNLSLLYRQRLESDMASSNATRRSQWSMPPWRMGMEDARVWISGPRGLVSALDDNDVGPIAQQTQVLRGRVLIAQHRTHLPRDTEWIVAFDVPSQPSRESTESVASAQNTKFKQAKPLNRMRAENWLPWFVLVWAGLKMWSARRLARVHTVSIRPVIAGPSLPWRAVFAFGLALAAQQQWLQRPWLAATCLACVVLLFTVRTFAMPAAASLRWIPVTYAAPRLGAWRRLRASVAPDRVMDASTPFGLIVIIATLLGLGWLGHLWPEQVPALGLLAVLIAPLWLTGTRLHLPWQGAQVARRLQRWSRKHTREFEGCSAIADEALVCLDEAGRDRDARIPIQVRGPLAGLRHVDVSLVTDARSLLKAVAMFVQTDADSSADLALQGVAAVSRRPLESGVMHIVPTQQIFVALAAIRSRAEVREPSVPVSEPDRAAA